MRNLSKRLLDVILASCLLVLLWPLLVVIAAGIRVSSGPPILYAGDRIGQGFRVFKMYKFRTMIVDADSGAGVTRDSDPRVTTIGRFLRRWKLDELPQLVNVLVGTMSIVGPRPESPVFLDEYTDEQFRVLSVKPGITGPTQLVYRHEERILQHGDFEENYRKILLPDKLALDLKYVASHSLAGDLKLILATARRVVESD